MFNSIGHEFRLVRQFFAELQIDLKRKSKTRRSWKVEAGQKLMRVDLVAKSRKKPFTRYVNGYNQGNR
jgi:hypothetical protein